MICCNTECGKELTPISWVLKGKDAFCSFRCEKHENDKRKKEKKDRIIADKVQRLSREEGRNKVYLS